jgi:hypothetical protein
MAAREDGVGEAAAVVLGFLPESLHRKKNHIFTK